MYNTSNVQFLPINSNTGLGGQNPAGSLVVYAINALGQQVPVGFVTSTGTPSLNFNNASPYTNFQGLAQLQRNFANGSINPSLNHLLNQWGTLYAVPTNVFSYTNQPYYTITPTGLITNNVA